MNRFTEAFNRPLATFQSPSSRRDALKAGGVTVTLGALIAACGNDRGGSEEAGRVGNAPPTTEIPNYDVDEAVLLRTAASLEYTAIDVIDQAKAGGYLLDEAVEAAAAFIENHQAIADQMNELCEEVGGEPWTCPNPWMTSRLVDPVMTAITTERVVVVSADELFRSELTDEQKTADVMNFVEAIENLLVASHQTLVSATDYAPSRIAHADACSLEARQAAELAIILGGEAAYVSNELLREDATEDTPQQFAIPSTFGLTSQIEIKAGPPDQNGVIQGFTLNTPAENSFVYNELSCEA